MADAPGGAYVHMEKKEEKKSLLKQSMEQGDNGSFALDMARDYGVYVAMSYQNKQYHETLWNY